MASWLPDDLPNLKPDNHQETSAATPIYNCIAWAAGDAKRSWWPVGGYWPKSVPREETLEAFVGVFEGLGYRLCEDASLEDGYEKIAIYMNAGGEPTHAALQLPDGNWTSKLGGLEDITH